MFWCCISALTTIHGLLHTWITSICRASHWRCGNLALHSSRQHPRSCRCAGSVWASRSSARLTRTRLPFIATGRVHHFVLALHCAGASQSVFWISWMVGTVSPQLAVVHRRGMNCACGITSVFAMFGTCPCITACMISTVFGIFLMVGIRFCIAGSSP